jgi:hypothetical protein
VSASTGKKERPGDQTEAQAAKLFDRHPTPATALANSGSTHHSGPASNALYGHPGALVSRVTSQKGWFR